MPGSTDLDAMLDSLDVDLRPERYTVATLPSDPPSIGDGVGAVIAEQEGFTVVATLERARGEGWPIGFRAAWLTLTVHSSLEAVGLTAAVSSALGEAGIACNVMAGYFHDHLLVPADRDREAVAILEGLRDPSTR